MSKLTDEEIRKVWMSLPYDPDNAPYIFARAIEEKVIQNIAMDNLVAWQQEFENSAQLMGNKPTNYAKLKEDFE